MEFLQRLKRWESFRRVFHSRASVFLVLGLVAALILLPDVAFAQTAAQQFGILETISLFLAGLIIQFTQFLGAMIALITEIVLVPVMSYNGFATSPVIGAGWAVVRDVMNMGFVIVLLIIAIVTIFGGQVGSWSVKWQQQIPKLLLFAILINFSRMICSFLIDIGQVIMLTFANAIKDIAGGNIIQVFGLTDFITFDRASLEQAISNNTGTDAFNLFTSALLALIMTLIVFGTMVMLTVILVYRIVTLWVLVVLSPLAFFFGGAEVLSKSGGGNPYAEWWKKFSGAVAIGPVLVFFLWLTLSVAGQGNIASAESFPMGGSSVDVGTPLGFLTKIADPGRFLSFIIGIGMLYVGFEASQKFADALPGVASNLVKGGVKSALKIGAGAGAVAGAVSPLGLGVLAGTGAVAGIGFGGVKAAQFAGKTQVGQEFRQQWGKNLIGAGAAVGAVPGLGWAGRYLSRTGTSLEQSRRQESAGRLKEQSEAVQNYNKDEIDAGLQGQAITPEAVTKQNALRWKVLNSAYLRKKYSTEDLSGMYQDFVDNGGESAVQGDSSMAQDFANVQKARPDLLAQSDKEDLLDKMEPDELLKMDPEAYRDASVQAALGKYTKYDAAEKKDRTYLEMMQDGKIGNVKQQEALKESLAGKTMDVNMASDAALTNLAPEKQTPQILADLVANGRIELVMQSPNIQVNNLPSDYVKNNAETISQSISAEKIQELANGSNGNAFRTGLQSAIAANDVAGRGNTSEQKEMRIDLVMSTNGAINLPDSGSMKYDRRTGTFNEDAGRQAFGDAIVRDASILARYKDGLTPGSDISTSAVQNASVNELIAAMRRSGGAGSAERAEWKVLLGTFRDRMQEYITEAERTNSLPKSELKRYRDKHQQIENEIR